jgi:hypothetical protein
MLSSRSAKAGTQRLVGRSLLSGTTDGEWRLLLEVYVDHQQQVSSCIDPGTNDIQMYTLAAK